MDQSPAGPAHIQKTHYIIVALVIAILIAACITGFARADKTTVSLVIDGSFVTNKASPNDIDIVVVMDMTKATPALARGPQEKDLLDLARELNQEVIQPAHQEAAHVF